MDGYLHLGRCDSFFFHPLCLQFSVLQILLSRLNSHAHVLHPLQSIVDAYSVFNVLVDCLPVLKEIAELNS